MTDEDKLLILSALCIKTANWLSRYATGEYAAEPHEMQRKLVWDMRDLADRLRDNASVLENEQCAPSS